MGNRCAIVNNNRAKERLPMKAIDDAIRECYVSFNATHPSATADEILCDPRTEDAFWSQVASDFPDTREVPRRDLNRRLLALRKRGAEKGGLPK